MKKVILIIVLALAACGENKQPVKSVLPVNRATIAKQFSQIDSLVYGNIETLEVHLAKMKSAAANEPKEYKAMVEIGYGILHLNRASNILAMKHYQDALKLLNNSVCNDTLIARAERGMGSTLKNTGEYPEAFKHLFKALKIYEKRGDNKGIAVTNGSIAQIYMQKNDIPPAKEHLRIAMSAMGNNKAHYAYLDAAHTLANIHGMSGDYPKALAVDAEGIRIANSIPSPKMASPFLDNKATCFMFSGQLDSAQHYYNECLKIDLKYGNRKQIADSYSNLGHLAMYRKNYPEAEAMALKSIEILQENDHKFNLHKSYEILTNVYKAWGKPEKALAAHEKYLDTYKKVMDEKKEAAVAEFKIVHDTENKERVIAENRVRLLESERVSKRRNSLLIGTSILAAFIAVTGWLIYRQQKLKNLQQTQQHELRTAIIQIENQNNLQQQRITISRDLHDNIGAQLTFIISSVENLKYAFDITNIKLQNRLESINDFTKATIVELRDTIWALNSNEITFDDLRSRIYNFIEKAKVATQHIDFEFTISSSLAQVQLSSVVGMNIYRTIQEAVNNAMKYAAASTISINIITKGNQIQISVTDDGSGFNVRSTTHGNGLANMKKRIADIGGTFELKSDGRGTEIFINIDYQMLMSRDGEK